MIRINFSLLLNLIVIYDALPSSLPKVCFRLSSLWLDPFVFLYGGSPPSRVVFRESVLHTSAHPTWQQLSFIPNKDLGLKPRSKAPTFRRAATCFTASINSVHCLCLHLRCILTKIEPIVLYESKVPGTGLQRCISRRTALPQLSLPAATLVDLLLTNLWNDTAPFP